MQKRRYAIVAFESVALSNEELSTPWVRSGFARVLAVANGQDIAAPFNVVITGSTKGGHACAHRRGGPGGDVMCAQVSGRRLQTSSCSAATMSLYARDQVRSLVE